MTEQMSPKDTASAITDVLAFVAPWNEESCSGLPISLVVLPSPVVVPVAVTVCCSLALASNALVLVVTANGVAADVSTDRCPVVPSILTKLFSDEGYCVAAVPVMSDSALGDG